MYHPLDVVLLALEAQQVVELRIVKLAWGGREGQEEARKMTYEKIEASIEASRILLAGGSIGMVVDRYRQHVAANTERLSCG